MQQLQKGRNKKIEVCIPLLNLKTGNSHNYHFRFGFKKTSINTELLNKILSFDNIILTFSLIQ